MNLISLRSPPNKFDDYLIQMIFISTEIKFLISDKHK